MNGSYQMQDIYQLSILFILWCVDVLVAILITVFLRFHIRLVLENKTTIENLERKNVPYVSKFDLGQDYNLY